MTFQSDKRLFKNEDLILNVTTNIDPSVWDETKYEAFIDELCGTREYQKEAIRIACRYLLGGKYANLRSLAQENYQNNPILEQRYGSLEAMKDHLQIPDKLTCSIDQATGTGKSYVLYGLAAILLAEGTVDRVLVLCPSNTIEAGLLVKFKDLASNTNLRDLLPQNSKVKTPRIINASETIVEGSICVENYHAILETVKSSIKDSLIGKGERVAVLNDEAHHVANESGTLVKKWKEFLLNEEYGFRIIVGVSGTCYVGDEYFADVIHRYSLRQAIEDRFVKKVEYVAEMPDTDSSEEKWQLIYNHHQDWKRKLINRGIRPLTIIVTQKISGCKHVVEELEEFLCEWEKITPEQAREKILPVTSSKEHQANVAALKLVDNPSNKVEWIVSVSMLSEGWDVKNVFQIVPHEERAFNSKLLIAQVLGRGLRRPDGWQGEDPIVTVFNHDAWSGRIRHLVNEILEIERRISSSVDKESPNNFELHSLDYTRIEDTGEYTKKGEYRLFVDGPPELPTQIEIADVAIDFERAVTGEHIKFKTQIQHKTWSVDEVAEQMYLRLKSLDEESKDALDPVDRTNYSEKYPTEKLEEVIKKSLENAKITSGCVTEDNRQKLLQALGTLRRKTAKRVIYKQKPNALLILNTRDRPSESCSAADLYNGSKTIFYHSNIENSLSIEQREFFNEVKDPDGDFVGRNFEISNLADFKTPVNLVIADQKPERIFVRTLCERQNSIVINSWLKNTPMGFYFIDYYWKKGDHPKKGQFSPDFFVKQENCIFITEIKSDEMINDPTQENIKKYQYATQHVLLLNDWLKKNGSTVHYQFNMLTPKSYNAFFQKLREKQLLGFRSELDVVISKAIKES